MFIRLGLVTALALAASPAGAAEQFAARGCEPADANAARPSAAEQGPVSLEPQGPMRENYMLPGPDPLGDILNARGPDSHSRLLAQYALYASIGNRDGMQIISDQLRRSGVPREDIEDFANRAKLVTGSLPERRRMEAETGPGWKLSH